MHLLTELRRRNVFRMAGLYLVGAWLAVQIAETLLPIFHTPDWVLQTLVHLSSGSGLMIFVRFVFFFIQIVCFLWMAILLLPAAMGN